MSAVEAPVRARPTSPADAGSYQVAIPGGHIYYHPGRVEAPDAGLFQIARWQKQGTGEPVTAGRGAAWFIEAGANRHWVLRSYRRGGWVGKFNRKGYLYTGERRTRAYREWRMLAYLERHGLPAPRPVAARYVKRGLIYRADVITERLLESQALSALLRARPAQEPTWRAIGACIRRFHDAGVCHADLNAHNILLNDQDQVWLIDFDKARIRKPGRWRQANLARLARSLNKLRSEYPVFHFHDADWQVLQVGYCRSPRERAI